MANWKQTINIDWTGETFEDRRDATVAALQASGWVEKNDNLDMLVDELSDTDNEDYFDLVWYAIYDEADYDRVWLAVKH